MYNKVYRSPSILTQKCVSGTSQKLTPSPLQQPLTITHVNDIIHAFYSRRGPYPNSEVVSISRFVLYPFL